MSKAIGSRYFRTILGNQSDRLTDGGIEARIADTIQVLLSLRSRAIDSNIKIAVENHAGDMQAWELKGLVEAAGPEYVGVNFDSGNACWSLEDPFHALSTRVRVDDKSARYDGVGIGNRRHGAVDRNG